MELFKNIEIIDLALYLSKYKTLIISDLHIGFEESLNKQGIFVPRFQLDDLFKRLKGILDKVEIKRIIINGDLKHEFGTISDQEWRDSLKLIDLFLEYSEVILVKGNHDAIFEPIAKKKNIKIVDSFKIDDICILHGNKILENLDCNILIIGHDHPVVSLRENSRVEKYKCFLKGKWKDKNLIVMPSFKLLIEGSDVFKEKLLSPYLDDVSDFEVFVVGDKIYKFGILKEI
ncbi:phosphoesterase [archaeon]|nr:phosphoesterase [archaeon]